MTEITLLDALMAEHEALGGTFPGTRPASLPALWTELHRQHRAREKSRAALCLSGGGIRSATFALGVLQGLAARGLLGTFDYLSTVSGGGYVGAWLSAWIHRSGGQVQNVEGALGAKTPTEPHRVADLNPREPLTLRHLREYSNYLTPRLGLFSADTWTLIGTYLRNLLLNWLALIPLLAAFLLLPRLLHAVIGGGHETAAKGLMLVGLILLAASVIAMTWWRPTVYQRWKHRWATTELRFLAVSLVPLLLGSLALVVGWAWAEATPGRGRRVVEGAVALLGADWVGRRFPAWTDPLLPQLAAIGLVAHLAAALVSAVFVRSKVWWWEAISGAIAGTLAGIGAWGLVWIFPALSEGWDSPLYTILAVPALLGVLLVATTVFVGLMSRWTDDEDREWWARYGGWILVSGLAWMVIATLVLYGPPLFDEGWKALSVAGVSGIWALIVGWSGFTAAGDKSVRERVGLKAKVAGFALDRLTTLAAMVFLVGLAIALSWATTPLIASISGVRPVTHENVLDNAEWPHVLVAGLGLFAIAMAVGLFLHVNRFSLHAMYRSRLIRAFLGASKSKRTPHPVTGFDPDDNVVMADLTLNGRPQRPFHVVNMALNLVGGADLAWQERQAESFTVSPLHAGSSDPRLGYRSSAEYGKGTSHAITLGTAITISGAAVSPNMGYNSSPAVTCVLALFNVRLGWWLGNPGPAGDDTFNRAGPKLYFGPMLAELLGFTDNRHEYVYLSDGGHFENLGLYEMVLRRCHFIVVSDAGCDPEGALDDLGSAIRKIRTDLGISITLDQADFKIAPRATATLASRYCAIGVIRYKDADGAHAENGILVYLKPGFHGDEPKDIFNYATAHRAFPHESTTDQWFSESQFESYRALGRHAADRMCADPPDTPPPDGAPRPAIDLAEFLTRIRQYLVLK